MIAALEPRAKSGEVKAWEYAIGVLDQESTEIDDVWRPQPGPQEFLLDLDDDIEDVFFGGAKGGGKTWGLLGAWTEHAKRHPKHARGVIFRATYPELEQVEEDAWKVFPALKGTYKSSKRTWVFPSGSQLKLRHLKDEKVAMLYQGHSYSFQGFDELPNWASSAACDQMFTCLRSAHGVPCRRISTGNPGGRGHTWVKMRYIDPAPPMTPFRDEHGNRCIFIPSQLKDNPLLATNDPGYVTRLKSAGSEWLVKAWLEGDWDIVAGGMFDDLWSRDVHVLEPFTVPNSWRIDRAFDWGSSKPFSVGWWAESDGTQAPNGKIYPPKTKFRIAEWYGWNGKPNEGTRMLAVEVARQILVKEKAMGYKIYPGPADSSIFAAENGVCIGDDMKLIGVRWEAADKSPGSRIAGWERLRKMLKAAKDGSEDAGLYVFSTCTHFIRTVPSLPRDTRKIDDVDTDAEDHIGDETRYMLMHKRSEGRMVKISGA